MQVFRRDVLEWQMQDECIVIGGGDSGLPEILVIVSSFSVDSRDGEPLVRLAVDAPREIPVHRKEIQNLVDARNKKNSGTEAGSQ